jgi:hypothetical protein
MTKLLAGQMLVKFILLAIPAFCLILEQINWGFEGIWAYTLRTEGKTSQR